MFIEICTDSLDSAWKAEQAGAGRIELCCHLPAGGLTPSFGMLQKCREIIHIPVHVLVRPRAGDFLYSDPELEVMKADIGMAKKLGFEGIVFGILTNQGFPDIQRIKEMVSLARPMKITFHRAFDCCADPHQALEELISCQIDYILTSGQKNEALEGAELIGTLVKQAGNRITIMAGSGINDQNIEKIRSITGVKEFHLSAKKETAGKMIFKQPPVSMGSGDISRDIVYTVDELMIRKIKSLSS